MRKSRVDRVKNRFVYNLGHCGKAYICMLLRQHRARVLIRTETYKKLNRRVTMMEKLMPYRWMLCVLIVYAVHMYPFYIYISNGEEETFIYEFLAAVAVISICSYKFGTEKGKVAGFFDVLPRYVHRYNHCHFLLHVSIRKRNENVGIGVRWVVGQARQ